MDLGVVLARVAVDQRVDGAQLLRKLEDRVGLGAGRRVCTRRQSQVRRVCRRRRSQVPRSVRGCLERLPEYSPWLGCLCTDHARVVTG